MSVPVNQSDQQRVTEAYNRTARFYDLYDRPMDLLGVRRRRRRLLAQATGATLEIGVGTGRNLDLYPSDVELTGIDVSSSMLARARRRAQHLGSAARLELGDVQDLEFPDDSFDTVTATCVFCSVADPVAGLREVARVATPDGQVLLLEHVRPSTRLLGWLADRISPFTARLFGPHVNRRTVDNITAAGLEITDIRAWGVWREITARRPQHELGDDQARNISER